ncbi:MAG: DUF4394 domain-containing protein [Acidobacteriota bacterium]
MRITNIKKSFAAMTVIALALVVSLIFGRMGRSSASAESELNSSATLTSSAAGVAQSTGVVLPKTNIYVLNADNTIFVLTPGATSFTRLVRVTQVNGNLIGIDFRPADASGTSLYGLTDTGNLYTFNLVAPQLGAATLVSTLSTRFAGGFQSLMDFNPVLNAVRLIGTNDQNFALVNSGGNLNVAAVQTPMAYAEGDVNAGLDPNICGGAYSNNFVGAPNTLFYGIDHDLDTLVTIATVNATGSSNTGGGQLKTIGRLVDPNGAPVNFSPTADLDIHTDASGVNSLIGVNGRTLFTIDLAQLNPSLALGTTQNVIVKAIAMTELGGAIDIAVSTVAPPPATPTPTPTPKPTPTPTPSEITFQAENGKLGGGSWINTNHTGFTGRGFVDFADNVANSFVEFSISQTGNRTLVFRYANGSAVNRTCSIAVNGMVVGTLSFPPTGSWETWKTVSLNVNLGAASGNKAVRVTATTVKGGPNLDKLTVQ